jgi:hypothetical protein
MATNASPFIVNIVPLQGIATGITSSDTASQITSLQTNVANIQSMVQYDTKTIAADFITSYTPDNTIQITNNLNLSTASLYSNGSAVSFNPSSLQFAINSYISGTASTISFVSAGNTVLQISTATTNSVNITGNLYVSQNAYVNTLYQTSDRTKKTNIKPFSTCLDDILELKPCSFNWLATGEADIGFIAQDVHRIWPSLSDGSSIAYSRFVPILLEGLRELTERVSSLEGLRKTDSS